MATSKMLCFGILMSVFALVARSQADVSQSIATLTTMVGNLQNQVTSMQTAMAQGFKNQCATQKQAIEEIEYRRHLPSESEIDKIVVHFFRPCSTSDSVLLVSFYISLDPIHPTIASCKLPGCTIHLILFSQRQCTVSLASFNCKDVQSSGKNTSGVYVIYPSGSMDGMPVYCDLENDGGGWLDLKLLSHDSLYFFNFIRYKNTLHRVYTKSMFSHIV
ncbi:hypothetical protein KUTeg_020903 [Tegillarca granosa]|uniref:Fibrinogen C-terminal domain-containing protein n=1 Tax=Tegillarca granosa TaxID=220873 RepID=A0ABQ9EDJ5_TEGGR|nr:hypothetical protein KUTeg_020903 [Tegillarca granosa]